MQQVIGSVVGLMASQEHAISSITTAANDMVGLAGQTNSQAVALHVLSGTLSASAGELGSVVNQFKL